MTRERDAQPTRPNPGPRSSRMLASAALLALGCSGASGAPATARDEASAGPDVVVASAEAVEGRYRGFNLQGMYKLEWNKADGFSEKDFQLLQEHGFNYARLPLDYKTYTRKGDWYDYLPEKLHLIDEAVRFGQRYGVHVALNLHQAPGYCVHDPASLQIPKSQRLDLWRDAEAEKAFVAHWRMFAERYADVSNEHLSFNLLNEPNDGVDEATYLRVMQAAMDAIHAVTPERTIELDGTAGSRRVIAGLDAGAVRQSLHAYDPHGLTHYGASWIAGATDWPVPEWPPNPIVNRLYGELKKADGLQTPLIIEGEFPKGTEISIEVGQVSRSAHLLLQADASPILEKKFQPGAGTGPWKTVVFAREWNIYQNIYNRSYSATTRRKAKQISLELRAGDWLTLNRIVITRGKQTLELTPGITTWGVPQARYALSAAGELEARELPTGFEAEFEPLGYLKPWKALKKNGGDVIVGEFGVYKSVPHDTALAFLKDLLVELEAADIGWALWDFSGDFGPFDSGRSDVNYEAYEGHQLDREMLELLEKY